MRYNSNPQSQEVMNKAALTSTVSDTHGGYSFRDTILPYDFCDGSFLSIFPRTRTGILEFLPIISSNSERVEMKYLTSYNRDFVAANEEPDNLCEFPESNASSGICTRDSYTGRIARGTPTIHLEELLTDPDECTIRAQLIGASLANEWGRRILAGVDMNDPLNSETAWALIAMINDVEFTLRKEIWGGDRLLSPRNNGTGSKSFDGYNILVSDAITSAHDGDVECEGLNSIVRDLQDTIVLPANYLDACELFTNHGNRNMAMLLEDDMSQIQINSEAAGHGKVAGRFFMRTQLWAYLSRCLPCQFALNYVCSGIPVDNQPQQTFNDGYGNQVYQSFRGRRILTLNGVDYEIVLDDTMPYQNATNNVDLTGSQQLHQMYFIPFTVMNGALPVTYMRYIDFRRLRGELARFKQITNLDNALVIDNGFGLFGAEWVNHCYKYHIAIRTGLVLDTPQYALRYENVLIDPSAQPVFPDPFYNGNA